MKRLWYIHSIVVSEKYLMWIETVSEVLSSISKAIHVSGPTWCFVVQSNGLIILLRDSLSCIPPRLSQSALRWTMRIHTFSLSAYLSSSSTQINMSSGPTLCLSWYGTLRQAHIRVISLPDCTFDRLGYRVRYIIGMGHILYESIPHWTSWLKHIWHKARRSQWQPRIHPHI